MKSKIIWRLLLCLLLSSGLKPALALEQDGSQIELTVVHASASPEHMAYWIAVAEGFLTARGIEVDNIRLSGGPPVLQSISAGKADIGLLSISTAIQGWELGKHPLVVAGLGNRALEIPMVSDSYLRSKGIDPAKYTQSPLSVRLAALKGSRWAVTSAGLTNTKLRILAATAGLNPDTDFQITPFNEGPAAALALLKRGTFDAIWAEPPLNQELVKDGIAVPILDPQKRNEIPEVTNALQSQIIVDAGWAQKNGSTLRKFVAAIVEASQFIHQQPSARVADGLQKEFPELSIQYLTALVNSIKDAIPIDAKVQPSVIETNIDLALTDTHPPNRPTVSDIYTESFLPPPSDTAQ